MSFRVFLTLVASGLLAAPLIAWSQDEVADDSDAEEQEAAADDTEPAQQAEPESTSYIETEEDDFRPSETISLDQSISFPTDI